MKLSMKNVYFLITTQDEKYLILLLSAVTKAAIMYVNLGEWRYVFS